MEEYILKVVNTTTNQVVTKREPLNAKQVKLLKTKLNVLANDGVSKLISIEPVNYNPAKEFLNAINFNKIP